MVSSRYVYINYFIIFILSHSLSHGSGPLFLKFIYQKQGKNPYLVVPHSRRTKVKVRSRKFDFFALSEFKTLVRCNLQFIARSTIILRFLLFHFSVILFPFKNEHGHYYGRSRPTRASAKSDNPTN